MNRRTFAQALAGLFAFPAALFGVVREATKPIILKSPKASNLHPSVTFYLLNATVVCTYHPEGLIIERTDGPPIFLNERQLKAGDIIRSGDHFLVLGDGHTFVPKAKKE